MGQVIIPTQYHLLRWNCAPERESLLILRVIFYSTIRNVL